MVKERLIRAHTARHNTCLQTYTHLVQCLALVETRWAFMSAETLLVILVIGLIAVSLAGQFILRCRRGNCRVNLQDE